MIADYLLEKLLNIGVSVAKNKTNEKINEHKLKKDLEDYILSKKEYFDLCSIDEEFDFEGLLDYVSNNLIEDYFQNREKKEKKHVIQLSIKVCNFLKQIRKNQRLK